MWKSCFSPAQFLITRQSGKTRPQLFSVITKQIIAECWGNFQIIMVLQWQIPVLTPVPFCFCWWQYISLCGWNPKYSSIFSTGAYYSLLWFCRDSLPQSVCWSCRQQRVARSLRTAAFSSLSSVFFSHVFLAAPPLLSRSHFDWGNNRNEMRHTIFFLSLLPPWGFIFSGAVIIWEWKVPRVTWLDNGCLIWCSLAACRMNPPRVSCSW